MLKILFAFIVMCFNTDGLTRLGKALVESFSKQCGIIDDNQCITLSYNDKDTLSILRIKLIPESRGKQIQLKGKTIRVWCEQGTNPFYIQKKRSSPPAFYDDIYEWEIILDSQGNLNPILTNSSILGSDDLERIVEVFSAAGKGPTNPEWIKDRVFSPWEVTRPVKYPEDEEQIRALIHQRFSGLEGIRDLPSNIPIVATLLVDESGKAHFDSLTVRTGIGTIDHIAVDICNYLCEKQFIPAEYQGHNVKSSYTVWFIKKDML